MSSTPSRRSSRRSSVISNKTDMAEPGKFTNFGGTERYRHKYTSYYTEETPKMRETAEADA